VQDEQNKSIKVIIVSNFKQMTEQSDLIQKLDELIKLFQQLKQKAMIDGVIVANDALYQNFDLLVNNYQLMKESLPHQLIEEMAGPLKNMISELVEQLKNELGTNLGMKPSEPNRELEAIDHLLKSGTLNEEQINQLLDERAKLKP
jgi:hypothetical protein